MRIHKKIIWFIKYFSYNLLFKNKRRSIALVLNSFDKGGLEQVVLNLYKQYRDLGYKTYILVQNNQVGDLAKFIKDQRHIYVFNNDLNKFLTFCWKKKINILHYHYNVFKIDKLKKMGFKTIYTIHNVYAWMGDQEIKERARMLSYADYIVAVSNFVKEYFCKRTNTKLSRVKVILNGIDFLELDNSKSCKLSKETLGINQEDIVFANIASFHRGKHQAVIIGAIEKIIEKKSNIKILFLGGKGDDNYFDEIMDMLKNSISKSNIKYVPYIDRLEMGYFLKNIADVFLLPSIQEGCSNAVLEALYCGLPMVLTKVGNAEEISKIGSVILVSNAFNDVSKLTIDDIVDLSQNKMTKNVNELSDAILKMIDNIEEYKKNAELKSKEALQFSANEMCKSYLKLIR